MTGHIYLPSYPYFRHARKCMSAGRNDNAVSYMEGWLGEYNPELGYGAIDPDSLKFDGENILFSTFAENLQGTEGEGI